MRKRTQARELTLKVLYQIDITKEEYLGVLEGFWQAEHEEEIEDQVKDFTSQLVKGVVENKKNIDEKIMQYAANWQLERMAVVDRNILRLSCYELLFRNDIPSKVSINEAVDLAKRYSGVESSKFVNAILDKIKQEIKR